MENKAASPSNDLPSGRPPADALPTLYAIATIAARGDSPAQAIRSILAEIATALRASSASVALVNPDTGKLEIEVRHGLPADVDDLALRLGQGITGWVAFHGKPQLVPDVSADPRYIRVRPQVRAEMAVPMIETNGQTFGIINLDSDTVGGFTPADLERLILFTTEATAVLQRLWQLHQLKGKGRQLEELIRIGQSLVSKLEPQELFDSVTRDARQITQTRACALYLYDHQHATIRVASLTSPTIIPLPNESLPIDSCLMSGPIHTRKQAEFPNIQSPEFADLADLPRDGNLRSLLATPLLYENEPFAVLVVFTDQVHRFNNDEKRLCAALASLAAVTLQNAQLYTRVFQSEESLRKNEQLTTLGLLAAEIAHEIRNPLTVIKLLYGNLGLEFPANDPRRTDVRVIGEKLDQLEAIVTRVLTFAKAPSSLHSRWNVADIIEDTAVLIRLKLAQSKILLQIAPAPHSTVIEAHKGQIQQVLLNLLLNAMQAMPDGGTIVVTTSIQAQGLASYAAIDISDTGTGIPESIRTRIFDSFLSGRPDGTGLGLAIAKRILLSHHGDIALLATSPAGTTMRITLPLAKS